VTVSRVIAGRLVPEIRRALARAIAESAEDLRQTARDLLDEPRAGAPSRPGEPPRRDSGRLRDGLFVRTSHDGLSAQVGTDLDYGFHLEFGTQAMSARPWLHPAIELAKPRIKRRIVQALRDTLAKGGRA
jgi:hypothetical protein